MELIQKLPFTLSAVTALLIGIISYKHHIAGKDAYLRMAVGMVLVFILGIYIRQTLQNILEDIERKRKEREEQEETERMEQAEEVENAAGNSPAKSRVDFKVDDGFAEEFSPQTVRELMNAGSKE